MTLLCSISARPEEKRLFSTWDRRLVDEEKNLMPGILFWGTTPWVP
ncbi:6323_t:CDS:1, partial [Acaulospora morrowiae]